jgi:hypothetical protein
MNDRPSLRIPVPTGNPDDTRHPRNTPDTPNTRQSASAPASGWVDVYEDITVDHSMPVGTLVYTT